MILREHYLIDLDKRQLFYGDARPVQSATQIAMYARDELIHSFEVQRGAGTPGAAAAALTGLQFRWGLKPIGSLHSVEKLAFSDIDRINIVGDWAAADLTEGKLSVRIDLNTVAIAALFAAASADVPCMAELEARATEGEVTLTTTVVQYRVSLKPDVVRGDAAEPEEGQPQVVTEPVGDLRYGRADGAANTQEKIVTVDGVLRRALLFPDASWRWMKPLIVDGQATFEWVTFVEA